MESKIFNPNVTTEKLPKIFLFIEGANSAGVFPVALAEDGKYLAGHCSSSVPYAIHDIGFNSERKHEKYREHYPNGYELIWIDNEDVHNIDFLAAIEKNTQIPKLG